MLIGARLRSLRIRKGMSQGDIEKATGLLRCYTSRLENGHSVPTVETLEKYAAAFGVPLYQLFYEGEETSPTPKLTAREILEDLAKEPGTKGSEARFLLKLHGLLAKIEEPDRASLVAFAQRLTAARP